MTLDRIRSECERTGISVSDLEKAAGLSNGAIAKWANSNPRVDSLKKVADFFHCTIDDLLSPCEQPPA